MVSQQIANLSYLRGSLGSSPGGSVYNLVNSRKNNLSTTNRRSYALSREIVDVKQVSTY